MGGTPFHEGHLEICQTIMWSLVLSNVIEINPRNHEGTTTLHLAVMNGLIELWKFMAVIVDDTNTEWALIQKTMKVRHIFIELLKAS